MTRAVRFSGSMHLYSTSIGRSNQFYARYGSGILSYWYKATQDDAQDSSVIFLARAPSGHRVRALHYKMAQVTPYAFLQLQDGLAGAQPNKAAYVISSDLLPYDNQWHNIVWAWDVTKLPHVVLLSLDGEVKDISPVPRANSVGFTIDYASANWWTIGGEDANYKLPDYFQGDLAEVYFHVANSYIDCTASPPVPGKPGKGFWMPNKKDAMEIGPTGEGATGLKPQIYCAVRPNASETTFQINKGTAGDRYSPTSGQLVPATSDPFPTP